MPQICTPNSLLSIIPSHSPSFFSLTGLRLSPFPSFSNYYSLHSLSRAAFTLFHSSSSLFPLFNICLSILLSLLHLYYLWVSDLSSFISMIRSVSVLSPLISFASPFGILLVYFDLVSSSFTEFRLLHLKHYTEWLEEAEMAVRQHWVNKLNQQELLKQSSGVTSLSHQCCSQLLIIIFNFLYNHATVWYSNVFWNIKKDPVCFAC